MEQRIADRQDSTQAKSKADKKRAKHERQEVALSTATDALGQARDIRAGLSAAIEARNHAKAFAAAVAYGDDQAAKAALERTLTCLATAGRQRGYGDA